MVSGTDDAYRATAVRPPLASAAGPALLIACAAASLILFWPGLASLVDAWAVPEYSHGPIIPLISTFLFLREMRHAPPVAGPIADRWPGVAVVGVGLFVGVLGHMVAIDQIITYGFMVWVAGVTLASFGLRRGAVFWPALVHLLFMLPLPQFVYWQVSTTLQTISSQIGVGVIALMGIPVYLDGNIIDLGIYKLQVAEACSGLRYLFPMLSFSYVFAVLYQGPVWHKVLLLAAAAPITVLMNSFRIGVIGVLVNAYGISHAEGFLHAFEGWIIFLACVSILFGLAIVLQQLTPAPKRLSETLDIEFAGLGDQLRRITTVTPSAAMGAILALTLASGLGLAFAPERPTAQISRQPFVLFPKEIDGWMGTTSVLDAAIERVLGADDYLSARFSRDDAFADIDLFAAYYYDQRAGKGIHSPEVCLPGGGWEVSRWETRPIELAGGRTIAVNRAIIQRGANRQLVYFWFDQRGRRMTGSYAAKAFTVWDSFRLGRTDGGIVRLITPLAANERAEAGDVRLQAFMDLIVDEIPRFIPE